MKRIDARQAKQDVDTFECAMIGEDERERVIKKPPILQQEVLANIVQAMNEGTEHHSDTNTNTQTSNKKRQSLVLLFDDCPLILMKTLK